MCNGQIFVAVGKLQISTSRAYIIKSQRINMIVRALWDDL